MTEVLPASLMLPPPLIHDLRSRSFQRLFHITKNPGNRGFGRYVRRQIAFMVQREKTFAEKAITVAYLGSFLVDHLVQAEKNACHIVESREMAEVEEHHVWERRYGEVIARILRELPDGEAIRVALERIENYSTLPLFLHVFRERHWRALARWRAARGASAERLIVMHVAHVFESRRAPAAKARAIAFAASLLADGESFFEHVPWPDAYRHVMVDVYRDVARHPDVLEAMV